MRNNNILIPEICRIYDNFITISIIAYYNDLNYPYQLKISSNIYNELNNEYAKANCVIFDNLNKRHLTLCELNPKYMEFATDKTIASNFDINVPFILTISQDTYIEAIKAWVAAHNEANARADLHPSRVAAAIADTETSAEMDARLAAHMEASCDKDLEIVCEGWKIFI